MATTEMQLGVSESRDRSNRVYLNLRTGKLSEVSKEPKAGFNEYTSERDGVKTVYYARTFDDLTAFVKEIKWSENEWQGKKIVGWNLTLDAGDGKDYVLQVGSGDRPYQTIMQVLPNVDFTRPVRIVAFMGKDQKTQKNQKVLLLTQNPDRTAKDWIKAKYFPKWLSTNLQAKLNDIYRAKKAGKTPIELTIDEAANVEYDEAGEIEFRAPYVKQNEDGTWNFADWNNFLIAAMREEVIPAVEAAADARADSEPQFTGGTDAENDSWAGSTGSFDASNPADDEIPF